jgi:hypothetical protein
MLLTGLNKKTALIIKVVEFTFFIAPSMSNFFAFCPHIQFPERPQCSLRIALITDTGAGDDSADILTTFDQYLRSWRR